MAKKCIYGFVDESGAPGVANGDEDYLMVSVALFMDGDEAKKVRREFLALRDKLKLSPNYEFHFSHNKPRIRAEVFSVMAGIDFKFMTFVIKKNSAKKFASYTNLAQAMVADLDVWRKGRALKMVIDTNPALYKELNKAKRSRQIKNMSFRQDDSLKNDGLQLVDYVAGGHGKIIKNERGFGFRKIEEKMVILRIREQN